jgi:hypothetical protein
MTAILHIVRMGPVAAEILAHAGDTEVAAVFDRSATIMTQHGFVTLGSETLGDGPLNVLLSANLGPLDWLRLGITREAKGQVAAGKLHIGETFAIDIAGAEIWQSPPWSAASRRAVAASLSMLRHMEPSYWPSEGFSRLVIAGRPDVSDRSARAAQPIIADLVRLLPQAIATEVASPALTRAATLLVGLGPGLTPSGDDFLGGLFLCLSALGRTKLRDALWTALAPEMDLLTTGLSGAHVAAAADGLASDNVHRALNALVSYDAAALPAHIATLRAIGHCSGCDTLAGIVIGLDAALAAAIIP